MLSHDTTSKKIQKVRKYDLITIQQTMPVDISYISSGFFTAQGEWIHSSRVINSYEIMFITKGEVYLKVGDIEHTLSENAVFLLEPGIKHCGFRMSRSDTSFYWFHFTMSSASWMSEIPSTFILPDSLRMIMLLHQLLDIANSPQHPQYAIDLIAATILCEVLVQHNQLMNAHTRLTKEIEEWIRINSDQKLTLQIIAKKFGYNSDYLARLFKSSFSTGIKEYICSKRIKMCENMLISTYYSIKQIADMMGFDNANQFVKFFKYHEQVSPKKIRDLYVNTHLNRS